MSVIPKLTAKQIFEQYDIPEGTLAFWRSKNIGPIFHQSGRRVYYYAAEIIQFIKENNPKRIHGRKSGPRPSVQTDLDLDTPVDAQTPDGHRVQFQTLPLDVPTEDRQTQIPFQGVDFREMVIFQIKAARIAAEAISASKAGKVFADQIIALTETVAAWTAQIERTIAK